MAPPQSNLWVEEGRPSQIDGTNEILEDIEEANVPPENLALEARGMCNEVAIGRSITVGAI